MAACSIDGAGGLASICRAAARIYPPDENHARTFLESRFRAVPIAGAGLLTAYYSPVFPAARAPEGDFTAPVLEHPPVGAEGLENRAAIEAAPTPEGARAWMRPEDLFFLQIQGSGILRFPDGSEARASFAGTNGAPYTAIGAVMRMDGLLRPGAGSADDIRDWLAQHRGPAAQAVMNQDARYVYLRLQPEDGRAVSGSAGEPLIPGRSLAVDTNLYPMGALFWIDSPQSRPPYDRLAVALDTGGAIRGPVRADLYLGGQGARAEAGRLHSPLRLYRLAPLH